VKELVDEALGLGPLEELLRDSSITESWSIVLIKSILSGRGKIVLSDKRFIDNNHIVQVIRESSRLSDGASTKACRSWTPGSGTGRASNAIIPPLAVNGPSITIRRFPEKAYAPDDLIRMDSISRPMVDFPESVRLGQEKHHHFGRNRHRQNHRPEYALRFHP